jgi:hypothetical protein
MMTIIILNENTQNVASENDQAGRDFIWYQNIRRAFEANDSLNYISQLLAEEVHYHNH